jgi:hypothetical protein
MDGTGAGWDGNTDVIVVVDPARRLLRWVPRDLWCAGLGDRINSAFWRGKHNALIAALGEHEIASEHSICLRREATESASLHLTITVPVTARLDFWYPESPNSPIEEGRKQVTFLPPTELLAGERIHQWIGARYSLASDTTDFDRLRRQQTLLARLLETRWNFGVVLADTDLVDISSAEAIEELKQVDAAWQMGIFDDVIDATVDAKMVLLKRNVRDSSRDDSRS